MRYRPDIFGVLLTTVCSLSLAPGCASTPPIDAAITVEGAVSARGAEPFSAYLLETDDRNLYVLNLATAPREGFSTPARLRVRGTVYRADWNGRPFAHLRVQSWERIQE